MSRDLPSDSFYLDVDSFSGDTAQLADAIFYRAYCQNGGTFERVLQRLRLGFSVLVYVPGSCMDAATRYIKKMDGGDRMWEEYGKHPGPAKGMVDVWRESTGIIELVQKMLERNEKRRVVFKNLDRMFLDNNDGVTQADGAQMALFSLIESTRNVSTLGLVDRSFGKLPDAVEAAFNERVWLREIALDRFPSLIPHSLAFQLSTAGDRNRTGRDEAPARLPAYVEWLLGSRLRWSDPIRAVMIMTSVMKKAIPKGDKVATTINHIWEAVRPMEFESADSALEGEPTAWESAFPPKIIDLLRTNIIAPYTSWRNSTQMTDSLQLEGDLKNLPPGVILYGPPGTGKTLLARYIAKSIGLPIRVVSGADLRLPLHGQAEKAIVDLFQSARRAAPCILVLDDADDLLGDRQNTSGSLAGTETAIVNTFLQQLEGFHGSPSAVLVILTTNRFSKLDHALRMRVPLYIHVPYPLDREAIGNVVRKIGSQLRIHLSDEVLASLVDRFEAPVIKTASSLTLRGAEERAKARTNQFSPREIQQALRMLKSAGAERRDNEGWLQATQEDVEKMCQYYEQLGESPEADEIDK